MKRMLVLVCGAALVAACSHESDALTVSAAERPESAAATSPDRAAHKSGASANRGSDDYREITIPAGTVLPVSLETSVGSDISRVEQPVHGSLRRAVVIQGVQVLPAGRPSAAMSRRPNGRDE